MGQKLVTVGASAIKLLEWNDFRVELSVTMLPTTLIAGNTGRVHVGVGQVPNSVAGDPNQGDALAQSDSLKFSESFPGDPTVPHNEIWAIATIAGQVVRVFEEVFDPSKPTRAIPVRQVPGGP